MKEMKETTRMSREKINEITQKLGITLDKTKKIVAEKKEVKDIDMFIEIVAFKEMHFPDISLCELFSPSKNQYIDQT
jgi:hypothetical protein